MGTLQTHAQNYEFPIQSSQPASRTFLINSLASSFDERHYLEIIEKRYPLSHSLRRRLNSDLLISVWFAREIIKLSSIMDLSAVLGEIAATWRKGHEYALRIFIILEKNSLVVDAELVLTSGLAKLRSFYREDSHAPQGYIESLYCFLERLPNFRRINGKSLGELLYYSSLVAHKIELARKIEQNFSISVTDFLSGYYQHAPISMESLLHVPSNVSRFVLTFLISKDVGKFLKYIFQHPFFIKNLHVVSYAIALGHFDLAKRVMDQDKLISSDNLDGYLNRWSQYIFKGLVLRREYVPMSERHDLQFTVAAYLSCSSNYFTCLKNDTYKQSDNDYFTKEQKKLFMNGYVSFDEILRRLKLSNLVDLLSIKEKTLENRC